MNEKHEEKKPVPPHEGKMDKIRKDIEKTAAEHEAEVLKEAEELRVKIDKEAENKK